MCHATMHLMSNSEMLNQRDELVRSTVENLYLRSQLPAARWMWETHVQIVALKAKEIAQRVHASLEQVVSAALLHDIADTKLLRSDENHDVESEQIARDILLEAGFSVDEVEVIISEILKTHSAYPENMPKTLEAKVVSTADAYGHLGTNFYNDMTIEQLRLFGLAMTNEEHRLWILKKIERDFNSKIFFENVREELTEAYETIKKKYS